MTDNRTFETEPERAITAMVRKALERDCNKTCVDECFPINGMCLSRPDTDKRMCFGIGNLGEPIPTISTAHHHAVCIVKKLENEMLKPRLRVRRLTPIECERLMGFPDNWTRIPWRGKPEEECPDSLRYKACGNSMCVNCMEWLGRRIQMEEERIQEALNEDPQKHGDDNRTSEK